MGNILQINNETLYSVPFYARNLSQKKKKTTSTTASMVTSVHVPFRGINEFPNIC